MDGEGAEVISYERLQARLIAWTIAADRRDRAGAPARPAYLAHAKTMNVLCSLKTTGGA